MRIAELVMAVALALLSLAIMWKSGEAPWGAERFSNVGFNDSGAPAGGFWPFWVALVMLLSAVWAFANGLAEILPPGSLAGGSRKVMTGLVGLTAVYPAYGAISLLWRMMAEDSAGGSEGAILVGDAVFAIGVWLVAMIAVFFLFSMFASTRDQRRSTPYLDLHGIRVLLSVGLPVFLLVLLTEYISIYFSMILFLLYYLLVLGRHGLILSVALALVLPFWMYLFFDITMTTTLPKGALMLEDAIYSPLGTWFRQAGGTVVGLCFVAGGAVLVGAAVLSARRAG